MIKNPDYVALNNNIKELRRGMEANTRATNQLAASIKTLAKAIKDASDKEQQLDGGDPGDPAEGREQS